MTTRTGAFRIGMRVWGAPWQQDLTALARWAAETGFETLDLDGATADDIRHVTGAGVDVICVDALDLSALLSDDPGRRRDAIDRNIAYFHDMAAMDVRVFFAIMAPENPGRELRENFDRAIESYGQLAASAERLGATVAVGGPPGDAPGYANLCCNPQQCRAILKAVPSKGLSLAFDPSHLVRMGIDHTRFLDEFATRIGHVHAKDTETLTDNLYEVGRIQRSLDEQPAPFGDLTWRYAIPGHGVVRWSYIFRMLQLAGYKGTVSVALEDADFNGAEVGEQAGLTAALGYLHMV